MILTRRKRRLLEGNASGDDERPMKKMEILAQAVAQAEAEEEEETWSVLPPELLELIMSRLVVEDNIRASAVCKSWLASALEVRVWEQPPWLMHFPKEGDMYEFCDPASLNTHIFELPELTGCVVRYSKEGWLLMHNTSSNVLFFFNPFTRELINVPTLEDTPFTIAFSSAPTSGNCWLFTVADIDLQYAEISTLHVGKATEWTTEIFKCEMPFLCHTFNKIVYANDRFYCLSRMDWLGIFDPLARSWDVLYVRPPGCPDHHFDIDEGWRKFMAESEGDIIAVYTQDGVSNPLAYELDLVHCCWEERKSLDSLTVFGTSLSSVIRVNLQGKMRSSVCLSNVRFFGKRCADCSVDEDGKYKMCDDCEEQWPIRFIWIDPPKNA